MIVVTYNICDEKIVDRYDIDAICMKLHVQM